MKETKQVELNTFGEGAVKVILKIGEINQFYQSMKSLKGILDNKKAISWGRDCRIIKEQVEALTEFQELITTDEFKSLQEEFTKLSQEAKDKSNGEIIKDWSKGSDYLKAVEQFNKQFTDHMKEVIVFNFQTKFTADNIHKIEDGNTAEMLSWFMD